MSRIYRDLLPPMRDAIRDALTGVAGREEEFVWALFRDGLPALEQVLRPTYGDALTINGVFCHGHPHAHFTSRTGQPVQPEAGDLLIVVHHLLTKRTHIRRSLLLQLKMADQHRRNDAQIELYALWPPFEFRHTRKRQHAHHHVIGGAHRGAQFAFIDRGDGEITIDRGPKRPTISPYWESLLVTELLAMMTTPRVGGREFQSASNARHDDSGWSPVVWDLLRTTFSPSTYAGNAPERDRVLNRGHLMLLLTDSIPQLITQTRWRVDAELLWTWPAESGDAPPRPPTLDDDFVPFDGPAVSTIVIEIDWSRLRGDDSSANPVS